MPENQWERMLLAATEEVLEKMFFTCVYGPAADSETEAGFAARLGFDGRPSGSLTIAISQTAAATLAANFLAAEPDDPISSAQVGGVVCELANMICGSLLSRVESGGHFRLSSPNLLAPDAGLPAGAHGQALDLGDGTLRLWLTMEEHAV
jgi:CheY-specific phosphatase CheX